MKTTRKKKPAKQDLVAQMAATFAEATSGSTDALPTYHRVGQLLNEQKKEVARGEWTAWLVAHQKALGFSVWKAGRMMLLSTHPVAKLASVDEILKKDLGCMPKAKKAPKAQPNGSQPVKEEATVVEVKQPKGKTDGGKKGTFGKRSVDAIVAQPAAQPPAKKVKAPKGKKLVKATVLKGNHRIEERFQDALKAHQGFMDVTGTDWKSNVHVARAAYGQGYWDGVADKEKGLV